MQGVSDPHRSPSLTHPLTLTLTLTLHLHLSPFTPHTSPSPLHLESSHFILTPLTLHPSPFTLHPNARRPRVDAESAAEAYADAHWRRRKKDFVAVAASK